MNLVDSIKSRLEKIECDGFSGIHPIVESNSDSINKLTSELSSSALDVAQLSSAVGKNCCIIFFDDTGAIDRSLSMSSNITASLIFETIYEENNIKLIMRSLKQLSDNIVQDKLVQVASKIVDARKYFHQITGDSSTAGVGKSMSETKLVRGGKSASMEFFAKVNNSVEDIGNIARNCVRKYQLEEKRNFVQSCEVKLSQ